MSLDPVDHGITNATMSDWRRYLKTELLKQRKYRSDYSGKLITDESGVELHEGIVTRANVPKGVSWHYLIFHPVNCFLLLPEEHRPTAPSRDWAIQRAYRRYGRDYVRSWYYGLPWKVKPFELP